MRQLQPYFINIKKRQVKSPKIYFRDSGLFHALLGISNMEQLRTHLKCGASWEGFALEEVIRVRGAKPEECFFWGVHSQGEVDLLLNQNGKLEAFEFKYSSSPGINKSMNWTLDNLPIDSLTVVSPVDAGYSLSKEITVKSIIEL